MKTKENTANKRIFPQYIYIYIYILMLCCIMAGMMSFHSRAAEGQTVTEATAQGEAICLSADGVDTYIEYEDTWTYTGVAIEPEVYVTVNDVELSRDTDYTVSYENNTECGEGVLTISGIGSYSGSVQRLFTIYEPETGSEKKESRYSANFIIMVEWLDDGDRDGKRPTSITAYLDDAYVTISEADGWSGTLYSLESSEIQWNLHLSKAEEQRLNNLGYTVKYVTHQKSESHSGKITLSYTPEKTSVSAEIEWEDGNNIRKSRPNEMRGESVSVKLMKTVDKETTEANSASTDGSNGSWSCTFPDVYKKENGREISYSVQASFNGYDMSQVTGNATDGFKIKAKLISQDLNVEINWDDEGEEAQRPDKITVQVGNNESIEVKASDGWKCSTTYWRSGKDLVQLSGVSDYNLVLSESESADGKTCTRTYTLTPKNSTIRVKAVWEDNEDLAGKRPESVPITLYRKFESESDEKWTACGTETLTSENNWTAAFPNMPKSDINWAIPKTEPYEYSVSVDEEVEGYDIAIDGYQVTLTYQAPLYVRLNWDDADDQDGLRPDSVELILAQDQTISLNKANSWTYLIEQWDGKEKPILSATPDGYTVTPELIATKSGMEFLFTLSYTPETQTIHGSLVWDDNNNKAGKRPAAVRVDLLKIVDKNSFVSASCTIDTTEDKLFTFENIAKKNAGQDISYDLSAVAKGYVATITGDIEDGFVITMTLKNPDGSSDTKEDSASSDTEKAPGSSDTKKDPLDETKKDTIETVIKKEEENKKQMDNLPNTSSEKEIRSAADSSAETGDDTDLAGILLLGLSAAALCILLPMQRRSKGMR